MWPKTGSELPFFSWLASWYSLFLTELIFAFMIKPGHMSRFSWFLTLKFTKHTNTCTHNKWTHAHFNVRFIFNSCHHFLACADLQLDLIWGLRCWESICMFLSNKWRALERLWLSMLKGLLVGCILGAHTHTQTHYTWQTGTLFTLCAILTSYFDS